MPFDPDPSARERGGLPSNRATLCHGPRAPHFPQPSNLNGYGVQGAVPGPPGGPIFVIPNSIDIESPAVKQAATACHDD